MVTPITPPRAPAASAALPPYHHRRVLAASMTIGFAVGLVAGGSR